MCSGREARLTNLPGEKNIRNFQSQGVHKFVVFDIGGNPTWGLSDAKAGFLRKAFEVFELLEHCMS